MNIRWIIAPILGCLIGYITNDIAIKMLFHPRKAIYIGRFHIPFTPGLIPQQKERIANAIGAMVSANLLDSDTLKGTLLSPKMLNDLKTKIQVSLEKLKYDERSLEQVLISAKFSQEKLNFYCEHIKQRGTDYVLQKLADGQIGDYVSQIILDEAKKAVGSGIAGILSAGGIMEKISATVNAKVEENAPELVEKEIVKLEDQVLNLRLCDIYEKNKEKIPQIAEETTEIYCQILEANLDRALAAIDISHVVVEKIRGFSSEQLEEMVFGVMKRELNAIVYLGALLGFFMGFINVFF